MSKLNLLTDWVEEHPINIVDMVRDIYVECFGEKRGLSEFSEYEQDVNNHIERMKMFDLEEGIMMTDAEIKIQMTMYVILKTWRQATFIRQQGALYNEDMVNENESLFILEHELCHRYPFLKEAFDILDDVNEDSLPF